MTDISVPFFRPELGRDEIEEVIAALRSGWLTTGPRVKRFEEGVAAAVGAPYAVAVNSCTAALHLAVEALGLKPGQAVLTPTMTFAATAEIIRYLGAIPILVDCDPITLNMDLGDAARKMADLRAGRLPRSIPRESRIVSLIPVHVGGMMMDMSAVQAFAEKNGLWVVEDAAHAFPAAWRPSPEQPWQRCGAGTAAITCFSFYANKTITTGEGGMAVTHDAALAGRMRLMSLHGLSHDAWDRFSGAGRWDYKILAPGFKYNLTDIAAAIGIHQLTRAEEMRRRREAVASRYRDAFEDLEEIQLPPVDANRIHSWHLFPVRMRSERLSIDRNTFIEELKGAGVGYSVHWRPLHLHPYYQQTFGWRPAEFPAATAIWQVLISLPIFPSMTRDEMERVVRVVRDVCLKHRKPSVLSVQAGRG